MSTNSILKHCSGVSEPIKLYLGKSYCLPVLSYALESLQLGPTVIWKLNVYWNSVYRKIFSYKPWESVRDVMKCLGKKNLEFIYYERKLCFYTVCFYLIMTLSDVLCLCMHIQVNI